MVALGAEIHIAALGHQQGVAERLGHLGEQLGHLLGGADVVGLLGHAHAVRIGDQRTGLDSQHDVLIARVARVDVVGVIRGDQARVVALGQVDQGAVDRFQLRDVMALQLQEEALAAEDVKIPVQPAPGGVCAFIDDGARHFGRHAARRGNQPFGMRRQELVVDARVVIEAIQLGRAGDFEQILIAGGIFSQQQHVRGSFIQLGVTVGHTPGRHVGFQADNGLNPGRFGGIEKFDHPKHGAVIGQGHRRHTQFLDAFDQFLEIAEAVQQRIFGMDVQVDKRHAAPIWNKFLIYPDYSTLAALRKHFLN